MNIVIRGWLPETVLICLSTMVDFTSSLYLGMKHSSAELSGWQQLTTGVPAALAESMQSKYVGNYIAHMQGFEKGITAPSTLHLYNDLYEFLARQKIIVFIDEKIYPVSKYGIEKLVIRNIPVYTFRHLDAGNLFMIVTKKLLKHTMPVVFTDGLCPQCGKLSPLRAYDSIIKPFNGKIFVDDTQALGILGKRKDAFVYGYGGGGTIQWLDISRNNIATVTSLAKAFGVPLAVISGSKSFISAFEKNSKTRENSSPVSLAHLKAAENAIAINCKWGDKRRKKLLNNILLIRRELLNDQIKLSEGLFPVQSMIDLHCDDTIHFFKKLNKSRLKTFLTRDHAEKPVITFIINYDHSASQIRLFANTIKHLRSCTRSVAG